MKELQELETFLVSVSCLVIKEIKNHPGKSQDQLRDILLGLVGEKLRNEAVAALTGLQNLPAEFKEAKFENWIDFVINSVVAAIPAYTEALSAKPE